MANNHYDITGVIRVKKLTPVIRALFQCYNLSENYPGNGEYSIFVQEWFNSSYPTWDNFIASLTKLCEELKINLPDEENEPQYAEVIQRLLAHYGPNDVIRASGLINIAQQASDYDDVSLSYIFELAHLLDDSHGLEVIQSDNAWYCDKPRHGEFGGGATYQSPRMHLYASSTMPGYHGETIDKALVEGNYPHVAELLFTETKRNLDNIYQPDARQGVANALVQHIQHHYNPIPQGQPATNDPVANPYETPAKIMSVEDQRMLLGEGIYRAASLWAEGTFKATQQERVYNAVRDVVQLIENGDGQTIPPMQLTPINYHPRGDSYNEYNRVLGDWNFDQPMPLAAPGASMADSYNQHVEAFNGRRTKAAKKMFGS